MTCTIWLIDGTLTDTNQCHSEPESNGNEGVLRNPRSSRIFMAQLAGAVENTDCTSAEEWATPAPMSVLDMTLNNLIVGLQ